jgi:nitrogen fixation NifU-like protein
MSDLRDLYQQLIIDHGRKPRNFGTLDSANHSKEGFNPLCGDKITVYLLEDKGIIKDIKFEGCGCAISMASSSLMTQTLMGKTVKEAEILFEHFHQLVTEGKSDASDEELGKLIVLGGVSAYPARVKCASLCWHTVIAALHDTDKTITTE